jgi:DHA2 family multidrug resistance protein
LVEGLNPLNPNYVAALGHMTQVFGSQGGNAGRVALGTLYQSVLQQAAMLSYIEVFYVLMLISLCALPLLFVMQKAKKDEITGGSV